ncbi:hypothetical protein MJO29_001539 [Puccinia striiformis f. sp. tritici]|uniref:REJ domain-containing protein n=3 Tax=Puccinia striiformis TaxID=27350 RepID=A0A0L0UXB9_9BASI|nr:hypothetical protein Pst134EA_003239 [Puccinia striiformis f. sp. tritici]KNE91571.1 hypothetical protein PSTG_15023 [Puccinia striiformis f. sp. tritici PST-78]POW16316.1 hypothetical protein PSTT_01522 [Puccinia striiformis]KAH9472632.1 hypothetical protein Pst134EA_003239 [Puccinia striiformis f. sp. tritici]KAI7965791.1 hypothetical protein MJO29_001539 [Puccinia striiformis f. sp. tritici]POW19507.1 hypothetical protein PSHT_04631 [Puccinia striiformis]
MPSTSVVTSCTVVAAIIYLAMSNPLPQTTSNMGYNPSSGQGLGAPKTGTANGSMDSAAMGANGMSNMGSGMAPPMAKTSSPPNGASSSMAPYSSTANSPSTASKSPSGMNMESGTALGGSTSANSMSPSPSSATSRPTAGGLDYSSQKNHTSSLPGSSAMGSSGMGAEAYGTGSGTGMYGPNSTVQNSPSTHVSNMTGGASFTSFSHYLLEVSGATIAFVLFA